MLKHLRLTLFVAVIFFTVLSGIGLADNPCFTCHSQKLFQKKLVHKPVAKGDCGTCHNPHVARYKGLLNKDLASLCFNCHQKAAREFGTGFIHRPVKKGECTACHNPHSSENPGLMDKKLSESCFECHKALAKKTKYSHQPFAKGLCLSCHKPHQADNGQLLVQDSDNLCISCHQQSILKQKHRNFPGQPKDCLSCHNPHGSSRKSLIRDVLHKPYEDGCKSCHDKKDGTSSTNCIGCHEEIKEKLFSTHSHLTAPGNKNICIACHSPHAGNEKGLLLKKQNLICRGCHEETLRRKDNSPYPHPEATVCSNCHDVHGSNTLAMLKGDGNTVCAGCHKGQGQFTHPVGAKIIDPRTGQKVSCVSCHYPMGTEHKYQLKRGGHKELCILCHRAY